MNRWRAGIARRLTETSVGTLLAATIGSVLTLAVIGIGLALTANSELENERRLLLDQVGPSGQRKRPAETSPDRLR